MAQILVIEDNPDNMALMTYLLNAFGHKTLTAHDGQQGLDVAKSACPDLIICDVHLPKVDGYEVACVLKREPATRDIPLVAVTALAMVGDRDKVLAAGFDGYIAKPIAPESFVAQIEAMLPTCQQQPSKESSPAPSIPAGENPSAKGSFHRVLVVDDSAVNRELIRSTLEPFGYEVALAATADAGLQIARKGGIDLIVSDLHMPDMDGYQFIASVKADAALSRLPFMFVSASVFAHADRDRAFALGADRFLLRPLEPQELLDEVSRLLVVGAKD